MDFNVKHVINRWPLESMQPSSSNFLWSSGSSRRVAVSSSREAVIPGKESDPSAPHTTDINPGALPKFPSGQRSSPIGSSEQNRPGKSASNTKNLESTLKGIESLHFNNDEKLRY